MLNFISVKTKFFVVEEKLFLISETGSGHTESTVSADIPIVPSRHIIDTTRTSFYYIPGQSFNLKVSIFQIFFAFFGCAPKLGVIKKQKKI